MADTQAQERLVRPTKSRWLKVLTVVLIGALIVGLGFGIYTGIVTVQLYRIPPARGGFVPPAVDQVNKALLFFFYDHPISGRAPLWPYETLYSNMIYVKAIGVGESDRSRLTLVFYQAKWVNNTKVILWNETLTVTIPLVLYGVVEEKIEIPSHKELVTCDVLDENGTVIFTFKHQTHPLFIQARRVYTMGALFLDRLTYICGAFVDFGLAVGLAKYTAKKSKAIPKVDLGTALWFLTMSILVVFYTAYALIMYLGLLQVWWTYLIAFPFNFIFGLFLVEQPLKRVLFEGPAEPSPMGPAKFVKFAEIREKEGHYYIVPGLKDFLLGRTWELVIPPECWGFVVRGDADINYYVLELDEVPELRQIQARPAPIHLMDVELWRLAELEVESLARALEETKEELVRTRGELEAKAIDYGAKFGARLLEPVLRGIYGLARKGLPTTVREVEATEEGSEG